MANKLDPDQTAPVQIVRAVINNLLSTQILWVVPYEWFKWTLVIVGALLSGGVLVLTFWSAVKDDTKRVAVIVISLIFLCHLLLASGFVVSDTVRFYILHTLCN